ELVWLSLEASRRTAPVKPQSPGLGAGTVCCKMWPMPITSCHELFLDAFLRFLRCWLHSYARRPHAVG
ncbi:unnamed protein product, partial [Symbiodinium pilosum]